MRIIRLCGLEVYSQRTESTIYTATIANPADRNVKSNFYSSFAFKKLFIKCSDLGNSILMEEFYVQLRHQTERNCMSL